MEKRPERLQTIDERIKYVFEDYKEKGGNQSRLAEKIGITKSAASQWKKVVKHIRPENLFRLQEETGFSAEWIVTGRLPVKSARGQLSQVERDWLAIRDKMTPQLYKFLRAAVDEDNQQDTSSSNGS